MDDVLVNLLMIWASGARSIAAEIELEWEGMGCNGFFFNSMIPSSPAVDSIFERNDNN